MVLPKAIIFDVDGTLADNERDGHRVAFNQAFRVMGLDWHWSVQSYGELLAIGGGKERIRHYIETVQPPLPAALEPLAAGPGLEALIDQLHRTKIDYYQQLLGQGKIPLRPGVLRLLQAARQAGIPLAIATTSALPSALALLQQSLPAGGRDWFEVIAAGDVVPAKKPAPDIYCYVLEQLGLGASDCLAIEDSPAGLKAALGAGLKTLVTVNDYTEGNAFAGAALVVSQLGEPGQPLRVIAGQAEGASQVDLALLAELMARPG